MSWLDFLPEISLPENVDIDVIHIGDRIEGDQVHGDSVEGDSLDAELAIRHDGETIPLNEVERIVHGRIPGEAPIGLSDNNEELILDPENFQEESEWEEIVKPRLEEGWRENGSASMRDAYPILFHAERSVDDEKIRGIKEFFRGEIFSSDFQLLQSALTIDRAINAPSGEGITDIELRRRKRQLADKYHDAAFSLPSMCSAGYFDEGEIFRHVHETMSQEDEYDVDNYDRVFRVMIDSKPFVAFVESSDSTEEVSDVVVGKIERLPSYDIPIPYIDVGGIGSSNHEKIRDAIELVDERVDGIEYDERVRGDELILRIDADSVR